MKIRTGNVTLQFMERWLQRMESKLHVNQYIFNELLHKEKFKEKLKIKVLDQTLFPSGKLYFFDSAYMSRVTNRKIFPIIAHANFMYGHDKKKEMLQARNLWLLENNTIFF